MKPDLQPLEVGRKYFMLTCTSVRPTVFRCDCGAEVKKRSLTHIKNGLRSCGCLARQSRETRLSEKLEARSFEVVDKTPGDKTRYSMWDVRCLRCGEESTVSDTHLRFGRIGQRCRKCPKRGDLTGERFGLLTVCKQMPTPSYDKKRNRYWECICECGDRIVVRTAHLRSGQSRSCGCKRRYDLWGKRFGRLTVVDRSGKQDDGECRWICDCDCGTTGVMRTAWQLRSGDTISCGCALKEAQAQFGQRRIEAWKKKKAAQAAAAQKATATP